MSGPESEPVPVWFSEAAWWTALGWGSRWEPCKWGTFVDRLGSESGPRRSRAGTPTPSGRSRGRTWRSTLSVATSPASVYRAPGQHKARSGRRARLVPTHGDVCRHAALPPDLSFKGDWIAGASGACAHGRGWNADRLPSVDQPVLYLSMCYRSVGIAVHAYGLGVASFA